MTDEAVLEEGSHDVTSSLYGHYTGQTVLAAGTSS